MAWFLEKAEADMAYFSCESYRLNFSRKTFGESVVFAFDLHNVVLLPDRMAMLKLFWHSRKRYGWKIFFTPIVRRIVVQILNNLAPAEPEFKRLCVQYPILAALQPVFITMIACQTINNDVVITIKALRACGYRVYCASNIWTTILPDIEKFFPSVLHLFDGFYFPSSENGFAYKPERAFYQGFMNKFHVAAPDIVFIDDDRSNIEGAKAVGWHCIQYVNAEDFKRQIARFARI